MIINYLYFIKAMVIRTTNMLTTGLTTGLIVLLTPNLVSALDEGTTIIGTKEAPNVLNVVPWKGEEFTEDSWSMRPEPASSVLDMKYEHLDEGVLHRENTYFQYLNQIEAPTP